MTETLGNVTVGVHIPHSHFPEKCKSRLGEPFKMCVGHLSLVLKFVRIVSEDSKPCAAQNTHQLHQPFTSVYPASP